MQLSVLLSALISFVILTAASPTPGAISKRSFERRELDTNFQRDLLEEDKKRDSEELDTDFNPYYAWYGSGTGGGGIIYLSFIHLRIAPFAPDKRRKELESGIDYNEAD
ncbi:uncharacterized protein HD556DRAFT_936243 [Suillus plorans]|uniref:Uncharacterized protein n=1 Tax=Suillus plorans TaxID=116603 RepID=A0A9P7AFH8_9AGAM|nr:uncharacterized protein HD556DRAFT_936243 [Suillus plorans]KAG1787740.1 hypothetical protein HD556DRAFT_936243 [Suillus plorans]